MPPRIRILALISVVCAGCHGAINDMQGDAGSDSGPDSGTTSLPDGGSYSIAPHISLPLLASHTGTVLKQPQLVTVSWSGFAFEKQVQSFGDGLITSQWLPTVASEYGFQSATHLQKTVLTAALPATMTDADLQTLINARIADGTLPAPATTPDVLFMIYFPTGTTLDASAITKSGDLCGGGYYGYHFFATYNGTTYPYAISGDCDGQLSSITELASHEILESITDPFNTGFFIDAPSTDDWVLFKSFESADMCQFMPPTTEFGNELERGWSNAAVMADSSPCVPVPVNEVPYSDVSPASGTIQTVAAGSSITVDITGWSVASRMAWPVAVSDFPLADFLTSPSINVGTMNNGTSAKVTLSVPAGTPSGKIGCAVIYSGTSAGGSGPRWWPITIQSQ